MKMPSILKYAVALASLSLCARFELQAHAQTTEAVEIWKTATLNTPLPRSGCFDAYYPSTTWQEITCVTVPPVPNTPASGSPAPSLVGNGNDFKAVTTSSMSWIEGSFPQHAGITSESDSLVGDNSFTFQINSNWFQNSTTQTLCQSSPNPATCYGWQQFVLANSTNSQYFTGVFIQYWLINYNAPCPSGWSTHQADCYKNSPGRQVERMSALYAMANLKLGGWYDPGGGGARDQDVAYIQYIGGRQISAGSFNTVFHLGGSWTSGEFNVFGYGNLSEANFNYETSVTVELKTYQGELPSFVPIEPVCAQGGTGFTGETNNLNLGSCSSSSTGITFTESNPCAPYPLQLCSGACVDLSSNPYNCGACGNVCAYGCSGGVCNPPPVCDVCFPSDCNPPCSHQTYCDGQKGPPGCGSCFCSQ